MIGLPADRLVRNPAPRFGLAWGALTFGGPAVVWLVVGAILGVTGHLDSELGDVAVFLGFLISVGAVFAGMTLARALDAWRRRQARR